jgi:hypothetical protein
MRETARRAGPFSSGQTRELERKPRNEAESRDVPNMDLPAFFRPLPKKNEKTLKKHEKVLAFPGNHDILSFHYASKQGCPLQFRV